MARTKDEVFLLVTLLFDIALLISSPARYAGLIMVIHSVPLWAWSFIMAKAEYNEKLTPADLDLIGNTGTMFFVITHCATSVIVLLGGLNNFI